MYSWQALFKQVVLSFQHSKAKQDFLAIRKASEALDRFSRIEELVEFLNDPRLGSRDEKDALLASVISCAQLHPSLAITCRDILLSAMRPALDRIFYALLPAVPECRDREGRLVNDIFWAFQHEVETWDFFNRTRVAATLKLNVLRKVKRGYIVEQHSDTTETDVGKLPAASLNQFRPPTHPETPLRPTADVSRIVEGIHARIPSLNSIDLHLLIGRFVHDTPFIDLAKQIGITEENARQRFNRVKKRLQTKKNRRF